MRKTDETYEILKHTCEIDSDPHKITASHLVELGLLEPWLQTQQR